ncbi:RING finger protein 37-like [Styela clava]
MSLDFANELFHSNISCSCVCADGYGVANLISKNCAERNKGFQGERFVRTPVILQLQFYVPISIHKVELTPYIGKQCCKVIQLYVSNTYPLGEKNETNTNMNFDYNDERFRKTGIANLLEPTFLTFVNRGYHPHPKLDFFPNDINSKIEYTRGNLSLVTSIRIIIRQMLYGSIPSLKSLRIWGRPSKSCLKEHYNEIMKMQNNLSKNVQPSHNINLFNSANNLGLKVTEKDLNEQETELNFKDEQKPNPNFNPTDPTTFPREFLDPLTCERMKLPVLLPSGHTVDRTTLDKHIKSQHEMGNIPSDPFTGIPFTEASKPQPNVELKLRLDAYFLKTAKDCNGNTLCNEPEKSALITNVSSKLQECDNSAQCSSKDICQASGKNTPCNIPQKRTLVLNESSKLQECTDNTQCSSTSESRTQALCASTAQNDISKRPHTELYSSNFLPQKRKLNQLSDTSSNHLNQLSTSLNTSLASLNNPQNSKKRKLIALNTETTTSNLYCSKCNIFLSSTVVQYRLQCSHIICSSCLRNTNRNAANNFTCTACNSICEYRFIERVHF